MESQYEMDFDECDEFLIISDKFSEVALLKNKG